MNELARVVVLLSTVLITACATTTNGGTTSNGLVIESVDDYTLTFPNFPLYNSVANGYGFEAIMLNSWLLPGGPWPYSWMNNPYWWNTSPWKLVLHQDDRKVSDADLIDGDLIRGGADQ